MITIRKIIERVDRVKPNAFSIETKLGWIAELDGKIALDVLLLDRSELSQFNYEYQEALDKEPLVSFPHDAIYDKWLIAQIDAACEEWERYANDIEVYNSYFKNYVRWIARTYQPAQGGMERCGTYPRYFLTAYGLAVMQGFVGTLDEWLLSLHGEPGNTPVAGEDYFTEEDKQNMLAWIREQLPNQTLELDASLTKEGFAADAKKTGEAIAARALANRRINGKSLTDDVNLTAADVGARPGDWMPSAADVGARPSNWIPSAAEVGARPSNWMPTIADIGAAPAGYGLGVTVKDITASDLDSTTSNGWYRIANDSLTIGGYTFSDWHIHVSKYSTKYVVQEMYTLNGYKAVRLCQNGTWHEEWENPPMSVGVEYRTTERWNGKVVYTKLVNYGGMPAQTTYSVAHGCAATNILHHCAVNETQGMPIPNNITSIVVDKTNITLTNNTPDLKNNQCRVRLWYTKD